MGMAKYLLKAKVKNYDIQEEFWLSQKAKDFYIFQIFTFTRWNHWEKNILPSLLKFCPLSLCYYIMVTHHYLLKVKLVRNFFDLCLIKSKFLFKINHVIKINKYFVTKKMKLKQVKQRCSWLNSTLSYE